MAVEHLAGDLSVARLVGPDETKGSKAKEKHEGANSENQRKLQEKSGAWVHVGSILAVGNQPLNILPYRKFYTQDR